MIIQGIKNLHYCFKAGGLNKSNNKKFIFEFLYLNPNIFKLVYFMEIYHKKKQFPGASVKGQSFCRRREEKYYRNFAEMLDFNLLECCLKEI